MFNDSTQMPVKKAIDDTNKLISSYKMEGVDWYDPLLCPSKVIDGIVKDSFKKFVIPDVTIRNELRQKAINSFLDDNSRLVGLQFPRFGELPDFIRNFISQAIFRDQLRDEDALFGPGESYDPSRSRTSAFQKLARRQYYTVTSGALPWMYGVLSRNAQFRHHIMSSPNFKGGDDVCEVVMNYESTFLSCVKLVHGDRLTTVPKDNSTDRCIGPQPLLNTMYQKQIGTLLRRACARKGNCLDTGQRRHRDLIRSRRVATIDLKGASNSNAWEVVQSFFPQWLVSHIEAARTTHTYVDGTWIKLNLVSSMGNGFTFELMSLFLLAVCRFFDPQASVFGDDIICDLDAYDDIVTNLQRFGYIINHRKSFSNGITRESCGSFMVNDLPVVRYDIKHCKNIVDCIVMRNKVYRLSQFAAVYCSDAELKRNLRKLTRKLTSVLARINVPFGPPRGRTDKVCYTNDLLLNQLMAVYLETHDESTWTVPATRREKRQNLTFQHSLQRECRTVTTWIFSPERQQLCTLSAREGPAALWCLLSGSGFPTVGRRGAGKITRVIITYSTAGLEGISFVHPLK